MPRCRSLTTSYISGWLSSLHFFILPQVSEMSFPMFSQVKVSITELVSIAFLDWFCRKERKCVRDSTLLRQIEPNRLLRPTIHSLAALIAFRVDFPAPVFANISLCNYLNDRCLRFELLMILNKFHSYTDIVSLCKFKTVLKHLTKFCFIFAICFSRPELKMDV